MDCISKATNEKEKKEYEKLLTPEARKLLKTEALDCLRHAKTEAQKKEYIKDLPKALQQEVLDKKSLQSI